MNETFEVQLENHLEAVSGLRELFPALERVSTEICERLAAGATIYTFGNGGSAADAQHLAAELIGRYLRLRRPLPAVALTTDSSVTTCIANDYSFQELFARQITALVRAGDVVIAFSTSGKSPNVVAGLEAARAAGALTVLLTGSHGSVGPDVVDHLLQVPSTETARIQEGHLTLLHLLSERLDRWAADDDL
jgi:D-sedoheptulose 7-phosphate isomerase